MEFEQILEGKVQKSTDSNSCLNFLQKIEDPIQIIFVIGPTASGKTRFSNEICSKIDRCEIAVFDSRQIFKEMNIGTGKDISSYGSTPHLIDLIYPNEELSVFDFKQKAMSTIENLISDDKKIVITVGTGLYLHSVLFDFEFLPTDRNLRLELEKLSLYDLQEKLKNIDLKTFEKIDKKNPRRLIRAIESATLQTEPRTDETKNLSFPYKFTSIFLKPEREVLYKSIDLRIEKMIEKENFVDEVKNLISKYDKNSKSFSGIGYGEIINYLENRMTLPEAVQRIKFRTHQYAKRQETWFKKTFKLLAENENQDTN